MSILSKNVINLHDEMVAYEALHSRQRVSFKNVAEEIQQSGGRPTRALIGFDEEALEETRNSLLAMKEFGICVGSDNHFPIGLLDDQIPASLFYYKGDIGLLDSRKISIVGARSAGRDGLKRAARIAKELVEQDFTIISGLAEGVDTAALTAAVENKGQVVAVIGTPINQYYPKKNKDLQDQIAMGHLLISEVPFLRYRGEHFKMHRQHFPLRNRIMSALSEATVIVEASEKSGTLTQARAAIQQGRKLFILNSCFENTDISWPAFYEKKGAIRVRETADILRNLNP